MLCLLVFLVWKLQQIILEVNSTYRVTLVLHTFHIDLEVTCLLAFFSGDIEKGIDLPLLLLAQSITVFYYGIILFQY